jgi:hypothetical protein
MGKMKKMGKNTCQLQGCLENLAAQFAKKQITLNRYVEGLSLLVAKKKYKSICFLSVHFFLYLFIVIFLSIHW